MFNLRKVIKTFALLICLVASLSSRESKASTLSEQITTDLLGAGISIGAALSGNTAVALSAGLLTKYVTTYGVSGAKKLISLYKGRPPRDLTEVNLYYVYLINSKRNLYYTLASMAQSERVIRREDNFHQSMDEVLNELLGLCAGKCPSSSVDENQVNFQFVSLALDARSTLDIDRILTNYQFKHTFHYMMLLYMDILYIEQMLMESMNDVLIERVMAVKELLNENIYLSKDEKNYLMSVAVNIGTRFKYLKQSRRVLVYENLSQMNANLDSENDDLQDQIDSYRDRKKKKGNKNLQGQLDTLVDDLQDVGTDIDPFSTNPLQTGSTLQNYYMSEKLLLLKRDTLFKLKANQLETTEEVADYVHRLAVMKSHSNNIMRQLFRVMKEHAEGKGETIGEWAQRNTLNDRLEDLVSECEEDATCVAGDLGNEQLQVRSVLVENLELASMIFKKIPSMHAVEVMSTYQLISLLQLEILYGQLRVQAVEFELFDNKQTLLKEAIEKNSFLSVQEKKVQLQLLDKISKQWKLKILDRKFNHTDEFSNALEKMWGKNKTVLENLQRIESENQEILVFEKCKTSIFNPDRQRCRLRNEYKEFNQDFFNKKHSYFKQTELPNTFFGGKK